MKSAPNITISALAALICTISVGHAAPDIVNEELGEQIEMLSVDKNLFGMAIKLETTIFKPKGNGPFPLFILTPGKDKGHPSRQPRARYTGLARELVNRGYVVAIPMPRGYSQSGGTFLGQRSCEVLKPVEAQGQDIQTVVRLLSEKTYIDPAHIIVAGHSFGGLSTLASAQQDTLPAKLILNFSGGMRFDDCDWQPALIDASGKLGQHGTQRSIWIYSPNDHVFPSSVVEQMRQAYGYERTKLVSLSLPESSAHSGFASSRGFAEWWPQLSPTLQALGFPTEPVNPELAPASYAKSGYAQREDVDKLPGHAVKACKAKYREMLDAKALFSFAFSVEGGCGWSMDVDEAMAICLAHSNSRNCKLYLADDEVVWATL